MYCEWALLNVLLQVLFREVMAIRPQNSISSAPLLPSSKSNALKHTTADVFKRVNARYSTAVVVYRKLYNKMDMIYYSLQVINTTPRSASTIPSLI
jgi:hypothetical protein